MNEKLELLINEVKKAVLGKDDVLKKVVIALLANGHILLEDIPGVGKTNLAVALTKAIQLDYQRVQLTSDVLPSDLLGYSVYDFETKEMTFKKEVDRYDEGEIRRWANSLSVRVLTTHILQTVTSCNLRPLSAPLL